jgi:hypothetical protein
MATITRQHLALLGWNVQGDIGPFTCWRKPNHRTVWFLRAPPKVAPSWLQQHLRERWKTAAKMWLALPTATRAQWSVAAKRAHLRASGWNLFLSQQMKPLDTYLNALEKRTRTHLKPR